MSLRRKIITAIKIIIKNPKKLILPAGQNGLLNFLSDTTYLKLVYCTETGCKLNLKNPLTFSEKLQWLKIYDHNPNYVVMVDKYAVRKYIDHKFKENLMIPLIGVYECVDDIPWDTLPKSFVLKCTHGSGCNILCEDKSSLNIKDASRMLQKWMKKNYYPGGREWPYKDVKPRIIAEKYMTNLTDYEDITNEIKDKEDVLFKGLDLTDYKVYCFDGTPKYCQVIANRRTVETIDFYDMDWNHMVFTGLHTIGTPFIHAKSAAKKPQNFNKMISCSKELSKDIAFVRIDFYEISGKLYFGEFTLYPKSGFGVFEPDEWNLILGELIELHSII